MLEDELLNDANGRTISTSLGGKVRCLVALPMLEDDTGRSSLLFQEDALLVPAVAILNRNGRQNLLAGFHQSRTKIRQAQERRLFLRNVSGGRDWKHARDATKL